MRQSLLGLLLGCGAVIIPALAQQPGPLRSEPIRIALSAPALPALVEIDIQWGTVTVRGGGEPGQVSILAEGEEADRESMPVTVREDGNHVAIYQEPLPEGTFRSANLLVKVAGRSDLVITVRRGGDISVVEVEGQIDVTNHNGSVLLSSIEGMAVVNASNGSIEASFTSVWPGEDLRFVSLNGDVGLCLPQDFNADVYLTTAGDRVVSDFPIQAASSWRVGVVAEGRSREESGAGSVEVDGTIGAGGRLLRAATVNGEIRLSRCGD